MRRRVVVFFAVVASVLAVTAMPVGAAQTNTVVGSSHTTDTDFNAATTLENVSIVGSGASARVEYAGSDDSFGFENEAADPGIPKNWRDDGRDPEVENVTTVRSFEGSQSYFVNATNGTIAERRPNTQPLSNSQVTNITFSTYVTSRVSPDGRSSVTVWENGQRIFIVSMRGGNLQYFDGSWTTISNTPDDQEWVTVTIFDIDPSANTFSVHWETPSDSGTSTGLSSWRDISSGYDKIQWRPAESRAYLDAVEVAAQTGDTATYISADHPVENPTNGWTNISTLENASATVTWQEDTGGSWTDIRSDTYITAGNKTVDISAAANSPLRVNVTFQNQSGNGAPEARLQDEGVLFTNHDPRVDNSSASPTGNVTEREQTLSIDVSDTEFGTAQGDDVELTFEVKGPSDSTFSIVGTNSTTSNGTVSVPYTATEGGTYQWRVTAEDEYGLSNTSDTFTFSSPAQLLIFNESDPTQLVDNSTVELEFYVTNGSQTDVFTRNTSTGAVNMTGLPADQPIVVTVQNESFVNRRIFIESLYETQNVYLLPESADYVEPTFVLTDFSGSFPPSVTVLQVERFLNGSWRVVEGDYFGATGKFSTHLAFNQRHRLTLINTKTGATRDLGPFTPVASGERDVEVFQDPDDDDVEGVEPSATIEPSLGGLAGQDSVNVSARFTAGDGEFSSYQFNGTYQYPNGTNATLFARSGTSATGETFEETLNLTDLEGGTVTLNASWTTASGTTDSKSVTLIVQSEYNNPYSLMSVLGTVPGRLPASTAPTFTTVLAVLSTVLVTSVAASRLPLGAETVGAIPVALLAFFTTIQWVGVSLLFIASVVWVAIVAVRRGI